MNILMVQDTFLPKIGGAEIHVCQLAQALRRQHHAVSIATATPGPSTIDGLPVHRFDGATGSGPRAFSSLLLSIVRILRLIWSHDVVHGHYSTLFSAIFGAASRLLGRRFIMTLHGLGTLESSVERSRYMRVWRRMSFCAANEVIATSREMERIAVRFKSSRHVRFVPNGVDTSEFSPTDDGPADAVARVVAVRRLVPKNGIQYLIEAVPTILQRSTRRVEFHIVGTGRLWKTLHERVAALGIGDSVSFHGQLANNQIRGILTGATVVVFPSSAESTSIAALEAMSMGKPIVASAVGGFLDLLGDGERGILVRLFDRNESDYDAPALTPDKVDALATAIVRVIENDELARRLSHSARQYVRAHCDWNHIAVNVADLYAR